MFFFMDFKDSANRMQDKMSKLIIILLRCSLSSHFRQRKQKKRRFKKISLILYGKMLIWHL
ncbi:hypothetical protein DW156_03840 [Bacteroides uniformis]|uniref:Uncharacterized protein n=1 Tax=Bacteroides uniformis TaxID=820 RepID=A0A413XI36_BACUN|nr:hypothetical protein DXB48_08990 [Bacteroides uniformis]RHB77601.1 hypothetical protein DW873_00990 [Bacteroides uniformis]RHI78259.1 hypothetical protein DW156_03840 [Bacteroides uniformis]